MLKKRKTQIKIIWFLLLTIAMTLLAVFSAIGNYKGLIREISENSIQISVKRENKIKAIVTCYSPYESCSNSGCIMASGKKVYSSAIACPRKYKFGTKVEIDGEEFICKDRTARRFDGRFDIFKWDYQEALNCGKKIKIIKILEER
ncbi:MAG: hypothetical protein AB1414_01195 [bacterium]